MIEIKDAIRKLKTNTEFYEVWDNGISRRNFANVSEIIFKKDENGNVYSYLVYGSKNLYLERLYLSITKAMDKFIRG